MKLTKSILRKMIGEQIEEITTSARGSGATLRRGQVSPETAKAKSTHQAAVDTKNAADAAKAAADADLASHARTEPTYTYGSGRLAQIKSARYKRTIGKTTDYSDTATRGFVANPAWDSWEGDRATKQSSVDDAATAQTTAASDATDAQQAYADSQASDELRRKGTRPVTAKGGARGTQSGAGRGLSKAQVASVMRSVQSKLAKLSGMEPTDPKGEKDSDEEE